MGERLEAAYGAEAEEQASELALHFRLGRNDQSAVRYLRLSAARALQRSAQREAIGHLTTALELLERHPDLPDAPRLELALQRMLGSALLVTYGWGDPGAERAYLRAREISEELSDGSQLARVLFGLAYLHEIRGEFGRSQTLLEERMRLAVPAKDPRIDLESHELLSCSLFHQGRFESALENAREALDGVHPKLDDPLLAFLGDNAAVGSHYWKGLALWFLGYPDQALGPLRIALQLSAQSDLIYMQAASRIQFARLHQLRGEIQPFMEHCEAGLMIAERQGYPYHQAVALTFHGWGRVRQGAIEPGLEEIRRGLAAQEMAGADMERPYGLGLLADALLTAGRIEEGFAAVDEALAVIARRTRTFFWEAELHRLRGELLLRTDAAEAAEASLRESLAIAAEQGAPSLELRAAMSLCRLGPRRGQDNADLDRLAAVYDCFSEGLDTPDLMEAAALLGRDATSRGDLEPVLID
jgi:tetratricopeptide (TPR) repeat protein